MLLEKNLKLLNSIIEKSRDKIVDVLIQGEKCACEIPELIAKLIARKQSNTFMDLTKLLHFGILKSRRN